MHTSWFITANAGRARFFSQSDPAAPWQEVEDMVNSAVRLRVAETEADRFGPTAAGKSGHNIGGTQGLGPAHNANVGAPNKTYQPAHTPAEQEAEQFARDISKYLTQAHQEGRFKDLVISASPQFLGALRSFLDPHVKSLVTLELNKDYTHFNAHQLREQLQAHSQTL
jgi:protein required for attachment to host cells